jgi:stress-induced morphogen
MYKILLFRYLTDFQFLSLPCLPVHHLFSPCQPQENHFAPFVFAFLRRKQIETITWLSFIGETTVTFLDVKCALKRHSKVHEENSDQFKCRKCDKSFGRKDQLMRHKQGVHNLVNFDLDEVDALKKDDEDTYTCKVCSKSFSGLDARYKIIDHLAKK